MNISALATSAVLLGLSAFAATETAEAATFRQTQVQNLTQDGQSLFFSFDGIAAGTATSLLVETGGSNFLPGIDLSGGSSFESEFFDLTADDDALGRYSCGGDANAGATVIPGTEGFMGDDCIFSLRVDLPAAHSTELLADGSLIVGVLFSDDVEAFLDNDEVEVSLTLQTIAPIPVPASLPLMVAGLGAFGVYQRRRAAQRAR